jgi:hypothetical protein
MHPSAAPVFVDDTGRRRTRARRAGRLLVLGFIGYLALLGAGFARDPHLGPLPLPTFGMPSLVHTPDPPATVLGEATTRPTTGSAETAGDGQTPASSSKAGRTVDTSHRAAPTGEGGAASTAGTGPAGGSTGPTGAPAGSPAGQPATTSTTSGSTTTTTSPSTTTGHGKGTTTTTTTTGPSSTTTTTTTQSASGQGANASSGKGPDASGPPGQARRPTTTTTSPTTLG